MLAGPRLPPFPLPPLRSPPSVLSSPCPFFPTRSLQRGCAGAVVGVGAGVAVGWWWRGRRDEARRLVQDLFHTVINMQWVPFLTLYFLLYVGSLPPPV